MDSYLQDKMDMAEISHILPASSCYPSRRKCIISVAGPVAQPGNCWF